MKKFTWKRNKGKSLGASLLYAMLIMLVCTVIASVVLAAATSAAGRIVKTSATDRRYYAVNSAVNLVKDVLSDEGYTFKWTYRESKSGITKVTVDYLKKSTYSETISETATCLSELVVEGEDYAGNTTWTSAKYGTRQLDELSDIFMNASLDLLLGTGRTENKDQSGVTVADFLVTAWTTTTFSAGVTANGFKITMEGSGVKDVSEVAMTTSLESNGDLTITIFNVVNEQTDTEYAVKLIFKPEIDDNTTLTNSGDIKVGDPLVDGDSNGGNVTTQNIRRIVEYERTVTYKWNLDSVVTLS